MASVGWEHGLSFLSGLKDLWPVVCSFQNLNDMDDIVSQAGMWLLAVTLHHSCLKITKSFGINMKICALCASDMRL